MHNLVLTLTTWAVLLLLAGCQTTAPAPAPTSAPAPAQSYPQVIIAGSLASKLTVDAVQTSFSGGDLLQVQANLSPRISKEQRVNYLFEWLDADGQALSSVTSGLRQQVIYPGQPVTLRGIATSRQAVDFRLIIRPQN